MRNKWGNTCKGKRLLDSTQNISHSCVCMARNSFPFFFSIFSHFSLMNMCYVYHRNSMHCYYILKNIFEKLYFISSQPLQVKYFPDFWNVRRQRTSGGLYGNWQGAILWRWGSALFSFSLIFLFFFLFLFPSLSLSLSVELNQWFAAVRAATFISLFSSRNPHRQSCLYKVKT